MSNLLRVAFAMPTGTHVHDYSFDYMLDGFKSLEERGRCLVDMVPCVPHMTLKPRAGFEHTRLPDPAARDACCYDSDQAWAPLIYGGPYDLVVVGAHALADGASIVSQHPNAKVCVIDGTDEFRSLREAARQALGNRDFTYFKREVPIGSDWGIPLPLTYPARRIPKRVIERAGVCYFATTHENKAVSRMMIADDLLTFGADAIVFTGPSQQNRPTPDEVHAIMWQSLIGIHWNSFQIRTHGWDSNRFPESLAYGLALVAQRPFNEMPYPFTHGLDVMWVDDPSEVKSAVGYLLRHPDEARNIGEAGHKHFLRYHCSEARAKYVLTHCGFAGFENFEVAA